METHCVFFEVGTEVLNIVQINFGFRGLMGEQAM
jgi:hypothetical protein